MPYQVEDQVLTVDIATKGVIRVVYCLQNGVLLISFESFCVTQMAKRLKDGWLVVLWLQLQFEKAYHC